MCVRERDSVCQGEREEPALSPPCKRERERERESVRECVCVREREIEREGENQEVSQLFRNRHKEDKTDDDNMRRINLPGRICTGRWTRPADLVPGHVRASQLHPGEGCVVATNHLSRYVMIFVNPEY